ncbi:Rrf2 family transcriptional regulator [Paenibacillus sp. NEAU-GSW1]|uniref:Rrf2 family transcriptional regulator n=1 Tax=Paenibacillus sp. NEAU-GSW1 TaxID=2682486 RepID=UPI0012E24DC9|nr:Rrf2 family transcriptional regulator [Paenibacillus sp. NEAU-GSW1]MUT66253.1 transcriptional regulator [Paenibacillus sp. NEAU-GSW1]
MTSNRFAVAVHILSLIELSKGLRVTSEYIAGSVNTNAVVIRRLMGMLNKAGLLLTTPGVAGATLARPASQITMLDIYRAVQSEGQEDLFAIHEKPNPACSVGKHIQQSLETVFSEAQLALEAKLASQTLEQVTTDLASRM